MPVMRFLLTRETTSSVGNVITRRVLVDAGKEWYEERIGVAVGEGEGEGSMVTRVMEQKTATGRLSRHPRA